MMYNDRIHMMEPALYGKYSSEKTRVEMRNAIKNLISEYPEMRTSKSKSPKFAEMVLQRIMNDDRVAQYFAGPEEFESVFHDVYQEFMVGY